MLATALYCIFFPHPFINFNSMIRGKCIPNTHQSRPGTLQAGLFRPGQSSSRADHKSATKPMAMHACRARSSLLRPAVTLQLDDPTCLPHLSITSSPSRPRLPCLSNIAGCSKQAIISRFLNCTIRFPFTSLLLPLLPYTHIHACAPTGRPSPWIHTSRSHPNLPYKFPPPGPRNLHLPSRSLAASLHLQLSKN